MRVFQLGLIAILVLQNCRGDIQSGKINLSQNEPSLNFSYFVVVKNTEIFEDRNGVSKIPIGELQSGSRVRAIFETQASTQVFLMVEHESGLIGLVNRKALVQSPSIQSFTRTDKVHFRIVDETQSELIQYEFNRVNINSQLFNELLVWNPKSFRFNFDFDNSFLCGSPEIKGCQLFNPFSREYRQYLRASIQKNKKRLETLSSCKTLGHLEASKKIALEILTNRIKFEEFLIEYLVSGNVEAFFASFPDTEKNRILAELEDAKNQFPVNDSLPRWKKIYAIFETAQQILPHSVMHERFVQNWRLFRQEYKIGVKSKCIANCKE